MLMQRYLEGIRWFWYVKNIAPGLLPVEVFGASPIRMRLEADPGIPGGIIPSGLGVSQQEPENC